MSKNSSGLAIPATASHGVSAGVTKSVQGTCFPSLVSKKSARVRWPRHPANAGESPVWITSIALLSWPASRLRRGAARIAVKGLLAKASRRHNHGCRNTNFDVSVQAIVLHSVVTQDDLGVRIQLANRADAASNRVAATNTGTRVLRLIQEGFIPYLDSRRTALRLLGSADPVLP